METCTFLGFQADFHSNVNEVFHLIDQMPSQIELSEGHCT